MLFVKQMFKENRGGIIEREVLGKISLILIFSMFIYLVRYRQIFVYVFSLMFFFSIFICLIFMSRLQVLCFVLWVMLQGIIFFISVSSGFRCVFFVLFSFCYFLVIFFVRCLRIGLDYQGSIVLQEVFFCELRNLGFGKFNILIFREREYFKIEFKSMFQNFYYIFKKKKFYLIYS